MPNTSQTLPILATTGRQDIRVLWLVQGNELTEKLWRLCSDHPQVRGVGCTRLSDLVLNAFGIQPQIAIVDPALAPQLMVPVVRQLFQASVSVSVLAIERPVMAGRIQLQSMGVEFAHPEHIDKRLAALLKLAVPPGAELTLH